MSIKVISSAPTFAGGDFKPPATKLYDLGSGTLQWRDIYLSRNAIIRNPADTFSFKIVGGALLTADRTLTIPAITADDTLAVLGLAQTFSAAITLSATGTALTVTNTARLGTIVADAGLVGTPSYTTTGDLNTGIFFPAADEMALVTAGASRMRLGVNGEVFINDTAEAQNTSGLLINQLTANNQVIGYKQNSVAHGLTTAAGQPLDTKTFYAARQITANSGGLQVETVLEVGGGGIVRLEQIYSGDALNTTKTTAGRGAWEIDVSQHDGANALANVVADGNIVVFRTRAAGAVATRFIWDTEGSGHADVEWVAFDQYNDLVLMKDFEVLMLTQEFGRSMLYHLDTFERAGIIGKNSMHIEERTDGRRQLRGMINFSRLAMMHHSTINLLGSYYQSHEERIGLLEIADEALRQELLALKGG